MRCAPAPSPSRARALRALLCALAAAVALALAAGCGSAAPGAALSVGATAGLPRSSASHVIVVVMENAEYGEVIGSTEAPYVNALARRYGLARSSYAIAHPSLPNYLALTSGATHGISSDCTGCAVSARNIVDQLEGAGISWGAYLEGAPAPCFRGAEAGGYAKKHNPFIYYRDIAASPARCGRLVGFGALAADLRGGRLPAYTWISPNLCDDGHDCGVAAGDRFLARTVPSLLRELGPHGFLVLTWDEGGSDASCCGVARGGRIATIVAGPDVRAGARLSSPVDHYGVLATIERAFGLPPLAGATDPRAGSLAALFVRPPRLR
ncbi:MAG TPA: alkaline phosphatase family protein [Solirubrobacteraceae bacterium]